MDRTRYLNSHRLSTVGHRIPCRLSLLLSVLLLLLPATSIADQPTAVMIKPAAVPAFDAIERGIRQSIDPGTELRVFLASDYQGRPGGVVEAALAEKPFVILAVGTAMSQAFQAALTAPGSPPILAVAISDPATVLGEQLDPPRASNITVILDGPPSIYADTADVINRFVPDLKKLGTVYNDNEANSVSNRDRIREEAARHNWTVVEEVVTDPGQVESIAQALLAQGVDAIWISKDRIMTSQPAALIEAAHARDVPVFASDAGTVGAFNALATRSVSFEQLGEHVGAQVNAVRQGSSPSAMPISTVEKTTVFVSARALDRLSMTIPPELAADAVIFGTLGSGSPARPQARGAWVVAGVVLIIVGASVAVWLIRRRHASHGRAG